MADGHTRKDKKNNSRYYQMILSIGLSKLSDFTSEINDNHYSSYSHTKNVNRVVFSNKRLTLIAEQNLGCGAGHKYISNELLNLPKKHLEKLILGYLSGDGSVRPLNHEKKKSYKYK